MVQYACTPIHARTLTGDLRIAEFYEKVAEIDPILAATWVADTLLGELNYRDMAVTVVPPDVFQGLLGLLKEGDITEKGGVEVLRAVLDQLKESGCCETPGECVERLGLGVLVVPAGTPSEDPVVWAAKETIAENPQAVIDFLNGRKEALNFLVGQVMKKTRGCAKPADVNRILSELLEREG